MSTTLGIIASSRQQGPPLLLDAYPGAAVACSLRKLRTAYTGFCIQVQRDSDGATLNIGFVNNVLDTTTLLTFVGAANGRVITLYDQSGNANDLTKDLVIPAPKIVNSGIIYTANSKPTILFVSTEFLNFTTSLSSFNPISLFLTQKANNTTNAGGYIGHSSGGGSGPIFGVINGNSTYFNFGFNANSVNGGNGILVGTNMNNINMVVNSTNYYPYINNTTNNFSISTWAPSTTLYSRLGSAYPGQTPNAYISEMIIYKTDQLANRTGIVNNTNSFYTLF